MNRIITKVKLGKDSKVHIEYKVERMVKDKPDYDEFTLNCVDKPLPAFELVFIKLRKHVLEICELPSDETEIAKVIVKGVSFSYSGENDVMGVTISASRTLAKSNAPLIINTPHKFDRPHNENQGSEMCLSDDCVLLLTELLEQAEKYLDGERAQLEIFDKNLDNAVDNKDPHLMIYEVTK